MALLQKTQVGGANTNDIPIRANISHSSPNSVSDLCGTSFIFSINTTHTPSTNNTPWIIDSGATDHITSCLHYFHTYSKIKPIKINLPNGQFVEAHITGTIYFSSSFAIHDVLYVPGFSFNLLSISKLQLFTYKYSSNIFFVPIR